MTIVGSRGWAGEGEAEPETVRSWDPARDVRGLGAVRLAETARDLARAGEEVLAGRAAAEALACLAGAGSAHAVRVRLLLGETYLALGRPDAGCAHLEAAVHLCTELGDTRGAAEARFAFGCARLQPATGALDA